MIRAVQKRFTAKPDDSSKKLDPKAIATGKQGVRLGVQGSSDAQFEKEAGVGRPAREAFERADVGSYGGEREARWRKAAKSSS